MWQLSLDNKTALVTGASRGIGKSIALQLGKMGAFVIGSATSEAGANSITAYFKENNIQGQGVVLRVDSDTVEEDLLAIVKAHAHPDILVNNAGITRDNLLLRMKASEWNDVINTNLTGVFRVTKTLLKGMIKSRWGRIIMVSSVVGTMGNPGQANYAATKAGVIAFAKSLAKEIASRGITVNSVSPGFIETDMSAELPEVQKEASMQSIPIGKWGQSEDIATGVGFLASEQAGYITGQTLHINGGLLMS
jgi:3-oxoacyl-[acyl-carrier protein] reductase